MSSKALCGLYALAFLVSWLCPIRSHAQVAVAASRPAPADNPVAGAITPLDVYIACRHDEASQRNTELHRLCNELHVPLSGKQFSSSHLLFWTQADIPDAALVRQRAQSVQSAKDMVRVALLGGDTAVAPAIRFAVNDAEVDESERELIARVSREVKAYLARDTRARVIVRGRADNPEGERGEVNLALAWDRAQAVIDELVRNGVSRDRIDRETEAPRGAAVTGTTARRERNRAAFIELLAPRLLAPVAQQTASAARTQVTGVEVEADRVLQTAAAPQSESWQVSASAVAAGVTDVLMERASEQMQTYVVTRLADELCGAKTDAVRRRLDEDRIWARRLAARADQLRLRALQAPPTSDRERSERSKKAAEEDLAWQQHEHGYQAALERRKTEAASEAGVAELQLYLPQTCGFFGEDMQWRQPNGVRSLRSAFEDDLRGMPERMAFRALQTRLDGQGVDVDFRDMDDQANARFHDVGQGVLFVLHMVERVEEGTSPVRALADLHGHGTFQFRNLKFHGATIDPRPDLLPLVHSLRNVVHFAAITETARKGLAEYWSEGSVPLDTLYAYSLRALVVNARDPLLEGEREPYTRLAGGENLQNVQALLNTHREIELAAGRLREVGEKLKSIDVGASNWRDQRREIYGQFVGEVTDLALAALLSDPERTRRAKLLASPLRRITVSTRTGRYAEALNGFMDLMRTATDSLPESSVYLKRYPFYTVERNAMRILNLAVTVSEAESQAEIQSAVRGFVGQSRDFLSKREMGGWRLSLNAYVGASAGAEWLMDEDEDGAAATQVAVSLPIGVEFGGPCGRRIGCGFFVPLVDLGAIASARLNDGDTETFPEFEVSRIFTPGLYAIMGLKGVPLTVGIGTTFAPGSRRLKKVGINGESETREGDAIRFGAFIGVDIPLFP